MPCSLVVLIHIRLIAICTMALASGIITSSHMTHDGLHGSIVIQSTLIMRHYKSIIRRLRGLLIPIPIRLIVLSVLWSIRMSMGSSIRCSMRWSIVRYIGSSMSWTMR